LHDELGNERRIERPPSAGVEDLVIVPSVVIALAISRLLKAVLSILVYVLDYAFPILLQLMRIPLLTARLIGDGMELLFKALSGASPCPVRSATHGAHECASSGSGSGATLATWPSSTRSTTSLKPEWRGCSENAES
jgi:hypothetical protein